MRKKLAGRRSTTYELLNAEEGIRTLEPTKGTALEAVAFDHFATSAQGDGRMAGL